MPHRHPEIVLFVNLLLTAMDRMALCDVNSLNWRMLNFYVRYILGIYTYKIICIHTS